MFIVAIFEPALRHETLTAMAQLNEVVGPFSEEMLADNWISRFQEHTNSSFEFVITRLTDPPELLRALAEQVGESAS